MASESGANESASRWVDVAAKDDFEDGQSKEFVVGEYVVAVFSVDGAFYALDGLCAHQGGPIAKGEISRTDQNLACVTCPWHGWQYELETGIQTVNRQPLQRCFPVRVNDGRVEVGIEPRS